MGKAIDSGALRLLNRIFRMAGSQFGAAQTDLDDANLNQVIDVAQVVRRSLTLAQSSGIFYAIFENSHAGAGQLHTSVNPYTTPVGTLGAYVTPIPDHSEIWLISGTMARTGGAGTLDEALLEMELPATSQAFGEDNAGAAVAANKDYPLGRWDSLSTATSRAVGITEAGDPLIKINMRIPRGALLRFTSDVAGAAADIQGSLLLGVFPIALGQDVVA